MKRRHFLQSSAATLSASLLPQITLAANQSEKKFIFVFNQGGWDPTRVFAPEFDNPLVSMEGAAEENQIGNLRWVSHFARPSVDSFVENHYENLLLINGVQIRSIAHEICTCLAYTGTISGSNPDWATAIAASSINSLSIPHLVLGGPSFAGPYGAYVVQTGGNNQLEELLDGSIQERNDHYQPRLSMPSRSIIDQHIQARGHAKAAQALYGSNEKLAAAFKISIDNAIQLQNQRYTMNFSTSTTLGSQIDTAIDALSNGISRAVSLVFSGSDGLGWDTHANNDDTQSQLFEALFSELEQLIFQLESTPDVHGVPLSESTTVVVFSEMGRTPALNGTAGKDHWPFTSVMIWGAEITGNRVIGSFSPEYQGEKIDLNTGEISSSGITLGIESIGAGLLALADLDPRAFITDADPLLGMLR